MSFFQELKRRNVIRVGIAYIVAGWVLVEAADILLPTFGAPEWAMRAIVLLLVGGLPIALLAAWMFELTPEGIKVEDGADTADEAVFKGRTDRKADLAIMAALGLAVTYFVFEKIWVSEVVRGNMDAVAILPFSDMSPQRDQEYFAEGLWVELLNRLSRSTSLRVTGRSSASQFKDFKGAFTEIGSTLNVGTILEGSVRTVDDNVRITTELIDANEGHTLWSANYDRKLTNIFQVQDEIARAVVEALQAQLLKADEEPEREVVPEAYTAYQQGVYLQGQITVEEQRAAIEYFQQAIKLDPGYAEPLVGLANANLMLSLNLAALDRNEGFGKATGYVDQALRLNSELPDALVVKSLIKQVNFRDFFGAELDLKQALDVDPNHIDALRRLGTIYGYFGRYDEAMGSFQTIVDRDPLNSPTYSNYSYNALAAGKLEIAERMILKALEFNPDWNYVNFQHARVLLAKDDLAGSKVALELEPLQVWKDIGLGMIACTEGDHESGIAIADALIEQREIFNAAEIYYMCGETNRVFELLNQAAEDRDPALTEMKLSWALSPLRDDPRWHEILQTMGLPL